MNFHPVHDRVDLGRSEAEAKAAGGIFSPNTAKQKPQGTGSESL